MIKYIILTIYCCNFLIFINCKKEIEQKNRYFDYVDPSDIQYLIQSNDLWISLEEIPIKKKIRKGKEFIDSGRHDLYKGGNFEIIGFYPYQAINNPEYFLIAIEEDNGPGFYWISSKIRKRAAIENLDFINYKLNKTDFEEAEKVAVKSSAKWYAVDLYEKESFSSKILTTINGSHRYTLDPIKFNYISNSTDRYFNKLGNWINVSYKNFSGFVFSSEVRPYIDYCSEFPGINKPIKQSNIGDIINVYSDEIDYDHSYGDYSALIIDENDESILIFIRKVYICGEAYNKFSLGKVLDIKKGPKIERFSNYSDNVRNHDCSNKENDPILVFWKNSPLDFEIQSTFHIDLKKEKIVELNSMNTVCKYECKTCND